MVLKPVTLSETKVVSIVELKANSQSNYNPGSKHASLLTQPMPIKGPLIILAYRQKDEN